MKYDKGSIIKKSNIIFKGTNKLDFRIGGHPVVLSHSFDYDDEYIYFLTLSSRDDLYVEEPLRYYLVKPDKNNKLKKPSIIDLKYIYKDKNSNIPETGILKNFDYKEMLKKLIAYQGTNPDSYFEEISTVLSAE